MKRYLASLLMTTLLAGCTLPSGPPLQQQETAGTSLRARGHEPAWSFTLEDDRLRLQLPDRQLNGLVAPQRSASGVRLVGMIEGQALEIMTKARTCRDSMSGMPHPQEVVVRIHERRYLGCGGEPAELLQGEWQVVDLQSGLPPEARLTLQFDAYGRVSARAGCNRYNSRYTLTGEALTIAPGAATRMACAAPLMDVENRFLRQLEATSGFDLDHSGALLLRDTQGRQIVARRPS